jgi:carbonic anhydrase
MVLRPPAVRSAFLRLSALSLAALLPLACAVGPDPQQVDPQAPAHGGPAPSAAAGHGAQHEAVLATEGGLGNAVRAHAPDSLVAVEQGYILPARTGGLRQSPIDILTREVLPGKHQFEPHYAASHEHIRNLGHTIQIDYDSGSYIDFEGHRYDLVQFHMHTPSEHRIDGMTFPMEIHLVHKRRESTDGVPHYLVIGALYKCGEENSFLEKFLGAIPEQENGVVDLADTMIHVNEVLEKELNRFYHYTGSLTTPPFTETVDWVVLQRIFEASPEQIARINKIEGNNARHVHALEGRTVDAEGLDR